MDHDRAQDWLDRYVRAWETYDPEQIGALFADDVEYRYHPGDEPVVGRDAVVRAWTDPDGDASTRDAPGTYTAYYEPWAIEGSKVVALGESRYYADPSRFQLLRLYDNVFLIEFDDAGRCRRFTELFVKRANAGAG